VDFELPVRIPEVGSVDDLTASIDDNGPVVVQEEPEEDIPQEIFVRRMAFDGQGA
jgi:hypothetical protein